MAKKGRLNPWVLMKIIVVPTLLLCAVFKRPVFQWIACAALAAWVLLVLADFIRSHTKERKQIRQNESREAEVKEAPHPSTPGAEQDEMKLTLLRQVNHRVMEQLKQSYPSVAWLWDTRPTSEEINKGCTKRIKLYHCDPFNFGEVTLSASGKLAISLIQLVPLDDAAEHRPEMTEDLGDHEILDRGDVKQWYAETGTVLLSELIDELNVQGHKRLVIKENGEVFVTASGTPHSVDAIPDFPPRPAWDDLCVLAQEDDITAEVCGQELAISWS